MHCSFLPLEGPQSKLTCVTGTKRDEGVLLTSERSPTEKVRD